MPQYNQLKLESKHAGSRPIRVLSNVTFSATSRLLPRLLSATPSLCARVSESLDTQPGPACGRWQTTTPFSPFLSASVPCWGVTPLCLRSVTITTTQLLTPEIRCGVVVHADGGRSTTLGVVILCTKLVFVYAGGWERTFPGCSLQT